MISMNDKTIEIILFTFYAHLDNTDNCGTLYI